MVASIQSPLCPNHQGQRNAGSMLQNRRSGDYYVMTRTKPGFDDLGIIREAVKAYEAWARARRNDSTFWRDRVKRGLEAQGYPVKTPRPPQMPVEPGDAYEAPEDRSTGRSPA